MKMVISQEWLNKIIIKEKRGVLKMKSNIENMNYYFTASEARKEWSKLIDSVVRDKPQFIKRTRDILFIADFNLMKDILDIYQLTAFEYIENDNTVTLSLNEIDLVVNGSSKEEAKMKLAQEILTYAYDYYENFQSWSVSPNRRLHIPYVIKALILRDIDQIGECIQCLVRKY